MGRRHGGVDGPFGWPTVRRPRAWPARRADASVERDGLRPSRAPGRGACLCFGLARRAPLWVQRLTPEAADFRAGSLAPQAEPGAATAFHRSWQGRTPFSSCARMVTVTVTFWQSPWIPSSRLQGANGTRKTTSLFQRQESVGWRASGQPATVLTEYRGTGEAARSSQTAVCGAIMVTRSRPSPATLPL